MPQSLSLADAADADVRTDSERQAFKLMLKNVNLLFLGVSVFVLTDRSYLSRFWTNFEAWLSMQDVSVHGLVPARHANNRCTIRCVHGAPEALIESLVEEWADCTAQQAYEKLRSADVQVTNQADKDVQLPKILELDQRVTGIANDIGLHREPSPEPRPAAYASQQWCVWDQDPDLIIKLSQTL